MIYYSSRSPALSFAAACLFVALCARYLMLRSRRLAFPIIDLSEFKSDRTMMVEASLKYPDTPFILPHDPPIVILPINMIDEVRNLPESKVSFAQEVQRIFHYKITGIGEDIPEIRAVVKGELSRNIPNTIGILQEETRYGFDKELGECHDWSNFTLYSKLVRLVALLSGRVFVGCPISRNEDWIESSVQYTIDCNKTCKAVLKYPSYLRKILVRFLPEIKRLKLHRQRGSKILEPIFERCLEKHLSEKSGFETFDTEQGHFMSWILNYLEDPSSITQLRMASYQMILAFASIHTTTTVACHALYDLMARPEYIQPLRDEIQQVMEEDGHDVAEEGNTQMKRGSLSKLKKLDSFIKESQRVNPLGLANCLRVCTSPLTLSSGVTLPKGTRFAFNLHAVNNSQNTPVFSPAYNPPSYKPPTEFDGFRFSNLRAMEGNENRHQFVTTSSESFAFGYGSHACPGRFFASAEIKIVLIELLRFWEFRFKGDLEGKGGEEKRPKNTEFQLGVSPNVKAEVEFRRRKV